MIVELGHFALVLALLLSLMQAATFMGGRFAVVASWIVFGLTTLALLALMSAYVLSDFSVLNVASNSNTLKPLAYKIAALWGNHEGSMLLWLWMMTGWSAVFAWQQSRHPVHDACGLALTLSVQGVLAAGFVAFILLTSNPFLRLDPAPVEGLDLNPVLQDPLLIIHPPFLYLGVTGFALVFAAALAALLQGRVDADFARRLRPWTALAWSLLTAGIALGSFWAYYELGWGGFWFWDPVENISLLPWLAGLALLHSLRALERRNTLPGWTLLLAIVPFILVVLGTFLVRSGLLTSVHAFAADPARGVFLLALTVALAASALMLYALRAPRLTPGAPFAWFSRDCAVLVNNVFMSVALVTVLLGTVYPLIMAALDLASVSVGAPYYVAVLMPMLLPFALAMGLAPALTWRATPRAVLRRALRWPVLLLLAGACVLMFSPLAKNAAVWTGMLSGGWILLATFDDLWRKSAGGRRWRVITPAQAAMVLAHAGFALMIIGATSATQWGQQQTTWLKPGDDIAFAGQRLRFLVVETGVGANYRFDRAVFALHAEGRPQALSFLTPEKRFYPVQEKLTSETSIAVKGFHVLHAVMGDRDAADETRWVIRLYYHPLVLWVFIGGALMAIGGAVSLLDRSRKAGRA